jgi:hypothetical protein
MDGLQAIDLISQLAPDATPDHILWSVSGDQGRPPHTYQMEAFDENVGAFLGASVIFGGLNPE